MTQDVALFQAMAAKMRYLSQRQAVLSQNVANADTPNYRPNDLKKGDFGSMLGDLAGKPAKLRQVADNPMHMSPVNEAVKPKNQASKTVYEVEPSGNSVDLEEQMVKESKTTMDYNLMTSLYQKNMSMMRTALDAQ
jgi:flagellar basal-body rod protein FlgB